MNEFSLKITMGNDAMLTPEDVAAALRAVAKRLEDGNGQGGNIRDLNGNTVGNFSFDLD